MKIYFCLIFLFAIEASAKPFNKERFENVIQEARSLNELIADQLDELDLEDKTEFEGDLPFDIENEPTESSTTTTEPMATSMTSTSDTTTTDMASTSDPTTTDMASTSDPTTTGMASTSETTTTSMASTTEPMTTNMASTTEETTTGMASTTESMTTGMASTTESMATGMASTTEETTTDMASTTKPVTTGVTSTTKPMITDMASTTEATTTDMSSTTESMTTPQPKNSTFMVELPFLQKAFKDLARFYWSLHTLRKMVGKNKLVFLRNRRISFWKYPYLIPSSTLIKEILEQIQKVYDDTQEIAAIASKGGFGEKDDESYGFKDEEENENEEENEDKEENEEKRVYKSRYAHRRDYHYLLKTEVEVAKVYWTMNSLIGYLKHVNVGQSTNFNFNEPETTTRNIENEKKFLKFFKPLVHNLLTELPKLHQNFRWLQLFIERKEKQTLQVMGVKHPHDK